MRPVVKVLCEGLLHKENDFILEAHSTSTLVLCDDVRIVVDTSSHSYRERLYAGLMEAGVDPSEVDVVVNTHSHHDHNANNDIFDRATVIEGGSGAQVKDGGSVPLCPGATIVHTPGHTPDSISVFVVAEKRYAIVGDALPTYDNFRRWVPPGINFDPRTAIRSMELICSFAQVIVPGHGAPFPNDR